MKGVGFVRETVAASAVLACIAVIAGIGLGHATIGIGLALGLLIGSFNGHLIVRMLRSGAPFVVSSLGRLALVSAVAILLAFILGASAWAVLIGVAGAQAVMVATAVRQGLRA